ncbi:diacylglycerol kinase family protein [Psychroflexus tropicus]|uniref:diacylglycerol kinase family protein n=1 Tax=Psychroflexus tropicus TaxID=197345 RepID=UPI000374267A|nr:diacylglycerol kinase family protein [Psychroflexus tropicus]
MFKIKTITERLKSLLYAWKGLRYLILNEDSFKFQLLFSGLFIIAGLYFNITSLEWCIQLIMTTLVLGLEGLNSSIELLSDYVQPEHNKVIGKVKDIAAGSVLISGIFAIVIALIIYIPYFLTLI